MAAWLNTSFGCFYQQPLDLKTVLNMLLIDLWGALNYNWKPTLFSVCLNKSLKGKLKSFLVMSFTPVLKRTCILHGIQEISQHPGANVKLVFTTEGNGNPLQYSCLKNPLDRGAWQVIVHGVAESDTTECMHSHTHEPTKVPFRFFS